MDIVRDIVRIAAHRAILARVVKLLSPSPNPVMHDIFGLPRQPSRLVSSSFRDHQTRRDKRDVGRVRGH